MSLSNGSAIGWESNVAGQRAGIGHSNGGFYFFRTASDPGTIGSPANYDMLIDDSGNVGIGTATPISKFNVEAASGTAVRAISTNSYGVIGQSNSGFGVSGFSISGYGVYGTSLSDYAGHFEGSVRVTGQVVQGSDARLKQDVASLSYGLREVLRLRPVTWNWKAKPNGERQLGLIAQEVETVLPELVTTDKDAEQTKGLSYIGLVPVTIKAIQEQQTQIEDQQKRITEQQQHILQQQEQNRKLEERLEALERLLSVQSIVAQ